MTRPTIALLGGSSSPTPDREFYGLELRAATGLANGTLYTRLAGLEDHGWLESRWESTPDDDRAGRPARRYYRLTSDGAQRAREGLAQERPVRHRGAQPGWQGVSTMDALLASLFSDEDLDRGEPGPRLGRRRPMRMRSASTVIPVSTHAVEVAKVVRAADGDIDTVCAALLHDVRESNDIRAAFGSVVSSLVIGLRELDDNGPAPADERILLLKLADPAPQHAHHTVPRPREAAQEVPSHHRLGGPDGPGTRPVTDRRRTGDAGRRPARTPAPPSLPCGWRPPFCPVPPGKRYLREWAAELAALPSGRAAFCRELDCWRSRRWRGCCGDGRSGVRLCGGAFATRRRPWIVLGPLVTVLTIQLAQSSLADALAFMVAVPPALAAGIVRIRIALDLEPGGS